MAATGSLLRSAVRTPPFPAARVVLAFPGAWVVLVVPSVRVVLAGRRSGVWVAGVSRLSQDDLGAVTQLVGAVDHDAIARRKSRKHLHAIAVGHAELDRTHGNGVVSGIDQIGKGSGHAALDARSRHRGHVLVGVEQQADVDELVREE